MDAEFILLYSYVCIYTTTFTLLPHAVVRLLLALCGVGGITL